MTPQNKLKELATKLGADLKDPSYNPSDRSYDVDLWAPNGKQWQANGCAFMGGIYWTYIAGSKAECYNDLYTQASMGIEDLDHEL